MGFFLFCLKKWSEIANALLQRTAAVLNSLTALPWEILQSYFVQNHWTVKKNGVHKDCVETQCRLDAAYLHDVHGSWVGSRGCKPPPPSTFIRWPNLGF